MADTTIRRGFVLRRHARQDGPAVYRNYYNASPPGLDRRPNVLLLVSGVTWLSVAVAVASDGSPKVTITGGADVSGHSYTWTVANEYASPIVYVEFPHYHAGLFFAPEGWLTESTYLVNVGVKDRPGVCVARVDSPANGIAPGRSAQFGMQIAARGAARGFGRVDVRFADGTTATVAEVELPQPESVGDKYVSLVGLGVVLAAAILIQQWRARRKRGSEAQPAESPEHQTN